MDTKKEGILKDLENILNSVAESENIKNYDVVFNNNPTKGDGFLSDFFTGEVLDKDNGQTIQVAIKKAPINNFTAGLENEEIYKNEVHFYSKAFPELDKFQKEKKVKFPFDHIPRFLTGNIESKNLYVAMQNIKTEGYVLFDKKKYLNSEHLEFIFKMYGKFHALSFSFKQKHAEEYENLIKNFSAVIKQFTDHDEIMTVMGKAYLGALETFNSVTEADILKKLRTIKDVKEAIKNVETYKGFYNCLVHGDCWSNNMLFKYKESGELQDIKLIDFQLACSSSPVHDLSYFFYSGASKQDMDKLDYYLELLYYESFSNFARELGENPEEIFPLDVLKQEWKKYGVWGVLLGCQLWLVKLLDRDEITNILDQNGLSEQKFWDSWLGKMAKIIEGAEEYRERARNICLHAVEYGVL